MKTLYTQTKGFFCRNSDKGQFTILQVETESSIRFLLVHAKVVYTDSVLASGKTSKDSFLYKAKVFSQIMKMQNMIFSPGTRGQVW